MSSQNAHEHDTLFDQASDLQRLFARYLIAILLNLTVLGLLAEHWAYVDIDSFTVTLSVAVVLQLLLKFTLSFEHLLGVYWNSKSGRFARFMRIFSAWFVLAGSKFVILSIVTLIFGETVNFSGPYHGVVAFVTVIIALLITEKLVVGIYRRLGRPDKLAPPNIG